MSSARKKVSKKTSRSAEKTVRAKTYTGKSSGGRGASYRSSGKSVSGAGAVNVNAAARQARIANANPEEYKKLIDSRSKKGKRHSSSKPQNRNTQYRVRDEELRNKQRRRHEKRRRRKRISLILFLTVLTVTALLISSFIFLKVNKIEVAGNSRYTATEIVKISGIKSGDSLFGFGASGATRDITEKLPYILSVKYKHKLSGTLVIEVNETNAAFAFLKDNKAKSKRYVLTSQDGKILEISSKIPKGAVNVSGAEFKDGSVGERIIFENEKLMDNLSSIFICAKKNNLKNITQITIVGSSYSAVYDGRYRIVLGALSDLDYKFALTYQTIKSLEKENSSQSGKIDVSDAKNSKSAFFTEE